jgi:hypothetical protein
MARGLTCPRLGALGSTALLAACSGAGVVVPPGPQEPVPDPPPEQHVGEGVVGQVATPPENPPQEPVDHVEVAEPPRETAVAPDDDYATPRAPVRRTWIYLGYRSVDEAFWEPVEDQVALGFEVTSERPGKFFGGELGMNLGFGTGKVNGFVAESSVIEFYAGLRKTWGDLDKRWHPYVGFGASALRASFRLADFDLGDWGIAPYAHAGIHYDVSDRMSVGVDVRSLFASSVNIGGISGDVDYTQVALALGWLF